MIEPCRLTATEALEAIRTGALTPASLVASCLDRIAMREPVIGAWAHIDPAAVRGGITALPAGPLRGLPVGVKDLIDTADAPTGYGSPIYAGHRPERDAAIVARLRALGAVIMGKTVTTEFATFSPGKTANPHNSAHTPGGSSSGSAAAVADFMVPIALGSQTAGSHIRPASFCGIVGFKGTQGEHDLTGFKTLAPSLDTLRIYARCVADIVRVRAALLADPAEDSLLGAPMAEASAPARVRIGVIEPPWRPPADAAMEVAVAGCIETLRAAGAEVSPAPLPFDWARLTDAQNTVMCAEMVRSFAFEDSHHADLFSPAFAAMMAYGKSLSPAQEAAARDYAAACRRDMRAVFAGGAVLAMPAALGEAPAGLAATGDPILQRAWTLLGLPCLGLPIGTGPRGLPLGAQFIGAHGQDLALLGAGGWIEARIRSA